MIEHLKKPMSADRRAAAVIGVLYLIGTVAFVLSLIVTGGALADQARLDEIAAHRDEVVVGALLVLLAGFALAMVPVVFWPVGRRHNETLAMGYVVFRGAIETILYIGIAFGWLVLLVLSAEPAAGPLADLVRTGLAVTTGQLLGIPFAVGALLFYVLLHRSRLVPRWLSAWVLVGAALYLVAPILTMFGSSLEFLMGPLAVQEMVLAVWLIARGFSAPAVAAEAAGDRPSRRTLAPRVASAA
jgi:Domain of unknown function (DUF4386)